MRVKQQLSARSVSKDTLLDFVNRELIPMLRSLREAHNQELNLTEDISWTSGAGSPEGMLSAPVGSLYTRTDGGAGTTLYVKESGSAAVGWIAK